VDWGVRLLVLVQALLEDFDSVVMVSLAASGFGLDLGLTHSACFLRLSMALPFDWVCRYLSSQWLTEDWGHPEWLPGLRQDYHHPVHNISMLNHVVQH